MQENRDFYLNVLEFQGQNSFSECLMDFYQGLVAHLLFHADSQPALSQDQIRMVSRFYAHGITGVLLDWAHNGMTADPEPAVTIWKSFSPATRSTRSYPPSPSLIPPPL